MTTPAIVEGDRDERSTTGRRLWRQLTLDVHRSFVLAILLVTTICVFVPFYPVMPAAPLDDAWALGINQAVAQKLTFGQDIIFTFGPYASIFSRQYHPATDAMMLCASGYLALTYWIAVVELTRGRGRYVAWGMWAILAGLMVSRDALLLSYPLLVGLTCCAGTARWAGLSTRMARVGVAVVFSPFGLLPLIKGSSSVLCSLIVAVSGAMFVSHKRWDLVVAMIASALTTMLVFWIAAGQPVLGLPGYVHSFIPVVFGYAQAMALPGDSLEIVAYIASALVMLAAVLWQPDLSLRARGFTCAVLFAYLFVVFKASFVRHVSEHALIGSTSLVIAALVLVPTLTSRLKLIVWLAAGLTWLLIDGHYIGTSVGSFARSVRATHVSAWNGVVKRLASSASLDHDFAERLANLKSPGLPLLDGTTDVYSHDQTLLIASGNTWNPRPMIQSYAVYGADIDRRNREHLVGPAAPDNIVFKVDPIDWRLPSLEDGASWPALLTRYRPTLFDHGAVILRRQMKAAAAAEEIPMRSVTRTIGAKITVPSSEALVFAEIEMKPTLLGRLAGMVFKPTALQITLNLATGQSRTYRFIANMGKLGVLLSPLVENTLEFATLYAGTNYLGPKRVESFEIEAPGGDLFWKQSYRLTFKLLTLPPGFDPRPFYELDTAVDVAQGDSIVATPCEGGVVDWIDGVHIPPTQLTVKGMVEVSGWFATSLHDATIPSTVVVVLTDPSGKHRTFTTRKTPRPDVGNYLHDPRLDASGYAARIDLGDREGPYTLEIGFQDGDHIAVCDHVRYELSVIPVR